jgi:hypothetical protein
MCLFPHGRSQMVAPPYRTQISVELNSLGFFAMLDQMLKEQALPVPRANV